MAVAYRRASTGDQILSGTAQAEMISRWADAHGVRVVASFEDSGVSGASPLDKRPALLEAVAALRTIGAGVLLAARRDRVGRDVVVVAAVEETVKRAGATLVTTDAGEVSGPEGALMKGIVDVFSQYERAVIRARTRSALAVKRGRGERIGGVPFGYRVADDGVHLLIDDTEQRTIAEVRSLRDGGLAFRKVVAACRVRGLVSRSGKPFELRQVARMCARTVESRQIVGMVVD
jgi:DNA invertase Pin-like site-specific DNA recombinase